MIYLSFLAVLALHTWLFSKRGLLDPVSVFFLAFLYYSYFAPISMLLFGIYGFDVAGQANFVTFWGINRSAIIFFIGYAGYAAAYYLLSKQDAVADYPLRNESLAILLKDQYARLILLFVIVVVVVLSTYFCRQLLEFTESTRVCRQ